MEETVYLQIWFNYCSFTWTVQNNSFLQDTVFYTFMSFSSEFVLGPNIELVSFLLSFKHHLLIYLDGFYIEK